MYGNTLYDTQLEPAMVRMAKLFEENYISTDITHLSHSIHNYFIREIYKQAHAIGKKIPIWTPDQIEEHIINHINDPCVFIGESIKIFSAMQMCVPAPKPASIMAL